MAEPVLPVMPVLPGLRQLVVRRRKAGVEPVAQVQVVEPVAQQKVVVAVELLEGEEEKEGLTPERDVHRTHRSGHRVPAGHRSFHKISTHYS